MSLVNAVNAAGRLDRLPMGAFQWRILSLIGLGMFFDGFDNQMAAGVLGALVAIPVASVVSFVLCRRWVFAA